MGLTWGQHGPTWASSGPSWGQLGANLGQLGPTRANMGQLGANLGPTWGQLGPTWANMRLTWGQLGANLGQLGQTWADLGPTLSQLGLKTGQGWSRQPQDKSREANRSNLLRLLPVVHPVKHRKNLCFSWFFRGFQALAFSVDIAVANGKTFERHPPWEPLEPRKSTIGSPGEGPGEPKSSQDR